MYSPSDYDGKPESGQQMAFFETFWDTGVPRFGEAGTVRIIRARLTPHGIDAVGFKGWLETRKMGGTDSPWCGDHPPTDPAGENMCGLAAQD